MLASVAAGDGERDLGTPLAQYYAHHGTPPGHWLGLGVQSLNAGMQVGDAVILGRCTRLPHEALGR